MEENIKPISTRIVFATHQTKGREGRSTFLLGMASWLDYLNIFWLGYDLDDSHRTFSARYPNVKNLIISDEITAPDELLKVFRSALNGTAPVILADTRAQLSSLTLDTIIRMQFFELAIEKGVRLTVPVCVADDDDSMKSLVAGMQKTGINVDYLIVRNPGVYASKRFDGSPLERTLLDTGAAQITVPPICESTRRAIARVEKECGHALSFPQAIEQLKDFAKADLEYFLSSLFLEFDRAAHLILPANEAAKIVKPMDETNQINRPFGSVAVNLGEE